MTSTPDWVGDTERQQWAQWLADAGVEANRRTWGRPGESRYDHGEFVETPGAAATAGWDGVIRMGDYVVEPLRDLHTDPERPRWPDDYRMMRTSALVLNHEASHVRTPRDTVDADAASYTASRASRALEEGTTELRSQVFADDFLNAYADTTRLPPAARHGLLTAEQMGTYTNEVAAVRDTLRRCNLPAPRGALDELDACPTSRRAALIADLYLQHDQGVEHFDTSQREQLRRESHRTVERHMADAPDIDAQVGAAVERDLRRLSQLRLWQESRQQDLGRRLAAADEAYAIALVEAGDRLDAGGHPRPVGEALAADQHAYADTLGRLAGEQDALDTAVGEFDRAWASDEIAHYRQQREGALQRYDPASTLLDERQGQVNAEFIAERIGESERDLDAVDHVRSNARARTQEAQQDAAGRHADADLLRNNGVRPETAPAMRQEAERLRREATQLRQHPDRPLFVKQTPGLDAREASIHGADGGARVTADASRTISGIADGRTGSPAQAHALTGLSHARRIAAPDGTPAGPVTSTASSAPAHLRSAMSGVRTLTPANVGRTGEVGPEASARTTEQGRRSDHYQARPDSTGQQR